MSVTALPSLRRATGGTDARIPFDRSVLPPDQAGREQR